MALSLLLKIKPVEVAIINRGTNCDWPKLDTAISTF